MDHIGHYESLLTARAHQVLEAIERRAAAGPGIRATRPASPASWCRAFMPTTWPRSWISTASPFAPDTTAPCRCTNAWGSPPAVGPASTSTTRWTEIEQLGVALEHAQRIFHRRESRRAIEIEVRRSEFWLITPCHSAPANPRGDFVDLVLGTAARTPARPRGGPGADWRGVAAAGSVPEPPRASCRARR